MLGNQQWMKPTMGPCSLVGFLMGHTANKHSQRILSAKKKDLCLTRPFPTLLSSLLSKWKWRSGPYLSTFIYSAYKNWMFILMNNSRDMSSQKLHEVYHRRHLKFLIATHHLTCLFNCSFFHRSWLTLFYLCVNKSNFRQTCFSSVHCAEELG